MTLQESIDAWQATRAKLLEVERALENAIHKATEEIIDGPLGDAVEAARKAAKEATHTHATLAMKEYGGVK